MKLTNSEWHLMNCLWQRHPATARGIAERLPDGIKWAYTTIRTLLARLVEKGAVKEHKKGKTSWYEPVLTQEKAQRSALKTLADQAFEGAFGPLMHFLAQDQKLTAEQRRELIQALEDQNRQ